MTGVGNRCHAETYLASRLSELDRHGWRFGAAFFDVDHFKRVNDTGGHEVGDRVLRMVATTGRNSLMASDVVSRRGGGVCRVRAGGGRDRAARGGGTG